jgi:hypothetical protein
MRAAPEGPDNRPVRLTDGEKISFEPERSPDGKRIVSRTEDLGEPSGLWRMRPDGTRKVRMAGSSGSPDWQPIP